MVKNFNKKNKWKKAQMKIQQMSFLLIAVFLFFALVGMIVVTVKMNELKNSAEILKEQNARLLATKFASSPEFTCGEVYGREKTDCIDLDKVMALKESISKYNEFWGISSLEIRKTYPKTNSSSNEIECSKTNYPYCNLITLINKTNSYDRSNYVALCRKEVYKSEIVNKCELGIIVIGYEGFNA